jgi:hypothetical protein
MSALQAASCLNRQPHRRLPLHNVDQARPLAREPCAQGVQQQPDGEKAQNGLDRAEVVESPASAQREHHKLVAHGAPHRQAESSPPPKTLLPCEAPTT